MCLKIQCDGESEKFYKIFWKTKQGLRAHSLLWLEQKQKKHLASLQGQNETLMENLNHLSSRASAHRFLNHAREFTSRKSCT